MSDIIKARRSSVKVYFEGEDVSEYIQNRLISLSYTDKEEDGADDLQIKIHDRDGKWKDSIISKALSSAASGDSENVEKRYKVTASTGATVFSGKESTSKSLGVLAYGTIVEVKIEHEADDFFSIDYGEKTGYIKKAHVSPIYSSDFDGSGASSESTGNVSGSEWKIGDEVTVTGTPQYTSYGTGNPGKAVFAYSGKITYLNLGSGVPYPIHVAALGWFKESEVSRGNTISQGAGNSSFGASSISKGLTIQASIFKENWNGDGKTEGLDLGVFELDSISLDGPPSTVTMKATSLSYASAIRGVKKSRSWEKYYLSKIHTEIASAGGYSAMFLCSEDIYFPRIEQYGTSDIAFLSQICHDEGLSLKVSGKNIIIFDQETWENNEPIGTIEYGVTKYEKYKFSTTSNDIYHACRVRYVKPDGTIIEAICYAEDYDPKKPPKDEEFKVLEINRKVDDYASALRLAKKSLKLKSKYEFKGSFELPLEPRYFAGAIVKVKGFGAFDGRYVVSQVKHSVPGKTSIELRRTMKQD